MKTAIVYFQSNWWFCLKKIRLTASLNALNQYAIKRQGIDSILKVAENWSTRTLKHK